MMNQIKTVATTICFGLGAFLILSLIGYFTFVQAFSYNEEEHQKVEEQAKIQKEYYNSLPEDELQEIKEQVQADLEAETCGEEWEACDDVSPYDGSSYEDINFRYDFEEEMIPWILE